MDEGTPARFSTARLAALSVFALLCAGCGQGPAAPATGLFLSEKGGFSLELPGDSWTKEVRNSNPSDFLNLMQDDTDNGIGPSVSIYEHKSRTRKELEDLRGAALNARKDDQSFKSLPIQEVQMDGRVGLVEDVTSINALAATMHRKSGEPAFKPVLYRETAVHVSGPKRAYIIRYASPISLYDKHRPAFDRLISSIKFTE